MSSAEKSDSIPVTSTTLSTASSGKAAAPAPDAGKSVQAFRLKMQGFTVGQIAKSMGVHERTVYRRLKDHNNDYVESMQSQPAINLVAEHIAVLEEYERLAMQDCRRATGNRDRHSFLKAAGSFRQQIIDLQVKVGAIPSTASSLHVSIQDKSPHSGINNRREPVTREELTARLLELVANQRQLPPLTLPDEGCSDEGSQN